ncbi:unnamed protein product [Rotaria socialis]|uniref:Uncharacterized protein n=1 Tax=Rotaria socialis TaxID=392032 RepID=A0A820BQI8_9BILA|nr:unnamed protein product [Rotaria socialis]CAF3180158.1 unnamed protein product [Rotaria socialis]CAF3338023.1 unnamed protein product [Rotaria socialis]CAF3580937.1 unnamed protein product [Rotaria socialis]CAF4211019.1 unnamed protein product [Rotaria socialis]
MTTTNSTSDVMDQLSPTLALDISMKEIDQNGREDERMVLVFNAFDQIIPQLGVFSPITAKLRNEFFDFIYSGQFTVEKIHNKTPKKRKRIACVERLAFKVLCHRLIDQHHEQSNMFENKIADMETNLAGKNRDLNQAFEKVEQIENAKQKLIDELASLKRTLNEKDNEIQKLKEECDRIRYNSDQEINKTRLQVKEIIENQAATEALIDDLSKYKQGYDEMQEAFTDNSTRAPSAKRRAAQDDNDNDAYVDVKNQIMLDIQVALRLEDQLSTLLNMTTEEYDQILDDEHTKLLQTQQFPSECHFIWDNIAAEKLRYAQTIKEIREEIDITQRHRRSLEEKLEMIVIKENEELKNRKVTAVFTANEAAQKTGKISNPLHGLEHAFESAGRKTDMIGYAPQERIISRFSYMLESSNNGRAWADFELSSFCDSCADKTYLCPHKFAEAQIIARVPDGTKYIRISRPILKYNDTLVRSVMIDNQTLFDQMLPPIYQQNTASIMRTNYPGYFNTDQQSQRRTVSSDSQLDAGPLIHSFDRVWADYKKRTNIERPVPRPFSIERLLTLMTEIIAYECYCDSRLLTVTGNIVDDIYEFFNKRYSTIDDITFNAVHDLFTSLVAYKNEFKILELFSHILIGNIDLAGIYYVTLLGDILDKIEWNETDDIRVFFNSIYPFLDEEGLDTVVIDFISYTENKISRHLVIEFIITLLLKGKEPLIQEMQYKLSVQLTQNFDMMNELEFHTAIENIAYTADERIVSRFFKRAERHSHWDNLQGFVLMTKLAHIAAFIYFTQLIEEQKEPLNERILKEYNLRRKSDGIDREGRAGKQITHEQMEPIKYFKLKALGQILYEPNITELPDDRKNLNASASFENENISQS